MKFLFDPTKNERKRKRFEAKKSCKENDFSPRKKKSFGQHFLRKQSVVDHMIDHVSIAADTSVLEIGCGDGFLTQSILLQTNCKQLLVYEIDYEWADFVKNKIRDSRLVIKNHDVLEVDFSALASQKPWVLLANLPYQITFPILFLLQKNKDLFAEGVVMVQEEVAQKIVSKNGKSYNPTALFLQYHFEWKMLEKIEPGAFSPPPKIFSRLLYFKPRYDQKPIKDEEKFWDFLKHCFKHPRQTLRNNLRLFVQYDLATIPQDVLSLRAQQITFEQFLNLWILLQGH